MIRCLKCEKPVIKVSTRIVNNIPITMCIPCWEKEETPKNNAGFAVIGQKTNGRW